MTPARPQTIEGIFHAALDCEPDELSAFLDKTCAGDQLLRREIETLLAAHQQAGSFIQTPVAALATRIVKNGQADSLIGQTIGHYKISKRIGSGGMGEVYLASDISAGRKAALKLLPTHLTSDARRLKRFQQEARAVAGLNHPNILTVYEVGADSSTRYIASELIEGETLRQRLVRGSMQLSEAVEIAIQVAGALAAAHQAGIVHRDVKPENIMLRPDGYVKVLDFGIAKLAEQEVPATMAEDQALLLVETNLGSVLGTVCYMSPEQACPAVGGIDKRTDIWSLGVVLYEMATGRAPFTGDTPREVMAAILATEPPPLSAYIAQAPVELQQIVNKGLRKDPGQRYQNAKEMLEALKGLRHKLEFAAELKSFAITRWIRSPTALALTVLAGALALAFSFYWLRNPAMSAVPRKSIAVLPFENLSGNPENAYFTDGIQEEILMRLAKVADLKVISRTSTAHYKSSPDNLREIAKQLGVANVLEGSVQRTADQVHVNVQLIKAASDTHLWAEAYDRKLTDIFAVESEIAKTIAETLQAKLTGSEEHAISVRPTDNPVAHELYLKGRFFWNKRTRNDLRKSVDYFNQAIEADPNYALAYAGLADAYVLLPGLRSCTPKDCYPKAKAAATKAIQLDATLAEAHATLGTVLSFYDLNFAQATSEFQRAIELNPNYATAHQWYGDHVLVSLRRFDEAIAQEKRALELDPLSLIAHTDLAHAYREARRPEEAIAELRKALEIDPNFHYAYRNLGLVLEMKGDFAEAIGAYQKARALNEDSSILALLAHAYGSSGNKTEAAKILEQLKELSKERYVSAYDFARAYLGLGDKEEALRWLDKSYQDRAGNDIGRIKIDAFLDPLRGDPRFEALVQKVFATSKP